MCNFYFILTHIGQTAFVLENVQKKLLFHSNASIVLLVICARKGSRHPSRFDIKKIRPMPSRHCLETVPKVAKGIKKKNLKLNSITI